MNVQDRKAAATIELANSEEFRERCEAGMVEVSTNAKDRPACKWIIAKFRRLVHVACSKTPWSTFERDAVGPKITSMSQVFGPVGRFDTFSPKVGLAACACVPGRPDPRIGPQVVDSRLMVNYALMQTELTPEEKERVKTVEGLPLRVSVMAANPIAQARGFQALVDAYCEILVGIPEVRNTKTAHALVHGVFGSAVAYMGIIEVQSRGGLHAHILLHTLQTNPYLISRIASDPGLVKALVKFVDGMVSASTKDFEHLHESAQRRRAAGSQYTAVARAVTALAPFCTTIQVRPGVRAHHLPCRRTCSLQPWLTVARSGIGSTTETTMRGPAWGGLQCPAFGADETLWTA